MLPGTGGLTRVVDKRHVRKDRADLFATKAEGFRGQTAVDWGLVDSTAPRNRFAEHVAERARVLAEGSSRPGGPGVALTPLVRTEADDAISYSHVTATIDRAARRVDIEVRGPETDPPADADGVRALGVDWWPMAVTRELDDLVLRLRTNETGIGTWVVRTSGDTDRVLAHDAQLADLDDWFVAEVRHYWKRTLKRLDVTSRSLIAVIEPGSCFAGMLAELALACDRQYMLDGVYEDVDPDAEPATIVLTAANDGAFPMGNGLSRLESRFWGRDDELAAARKAIGDRLDAARGRRARPGHLGARRPRPRGRPPDRARGAGVALARRAHRHGGQPPVRRARDGRVEDLRPADGLAELDLLPPQRLRPRRGAAAVRLGPARLLRLPAGVR